MKGGAFLSDEVPLQIICKGTPIQIQVKPIQLTTVHLSARNRFCDYYSYCICWWHRVKKELTFSYRFAKTAICNPLLLLYDVIN
jgi:hypothetical protein